MKNSCTHSEYRFWDVNTGSDDVRLRCTMPNGPVHIPVTITGDKLIVDHEAAKKAGLTVAKKVKPGFAEGT